VKGLLSVKFIFVLAAPIVKQKKWHIETFGEEVLEGETPGKMDQIPGGLPPSTARFLHPQPADVKQLRH
jgi:hypothetical protein